ncbi:MAG TPA: cytochrome c oxidase subunit II [Longimicrobium sp.]
MTPARRAAGACTLVLAAATAACAGAPSYLRPAGAPADGEARLGWWLLASAGAVVVAVTALLVAGLLRRRRGEAPGDPVRWIHAGAGFSIVVLLAVFAGLVAGLAYASRMPGRPAAVVEVTGHQWWWELRYLGTPAEDVFITANEVHVPVGRPVRFRVTSMDVIHSFWVPELGGKIDMIPGRTNETWLRADRPGVYRGQCGEFCGRQHARMDFVVVAQSPAAFAAWRAEQRRAGRAPAGAEARAGRQIFEQRCGACHAVRGTEGLGLVGPDLTHVGSRLTLAAGTIPNTPADMDRWIADPQRVKPGTLMPVVGLTPRERRAVVAYLQQLR